MKQQASLMIYTLQLTPRVSYAFSLLLTHILQINYVLTDQIEVYHQCKGPKISYTPPTKKMNGSWLPASSLLFENDIKPIPNLLVEQYKDHPILFPLPYKEALLPFDFPAMAFYLVSRYEEYLAFNGDQFGRFPATESLAAKNGFLQCPIINHWALHLGDILRARFPKIRIKQPSFRFSITLDIDYAWAYKNRPLWLSLAGALRDLLHWNSTTFWQRWRVLLNKEKDPFNTFNQLFQWQEETGLPMRFFFLLGDYGKYDKNIDSKNSQFQKLIDQVSKKLPVGIHPSFASNDKAPLLSKEIKRLSTAIEKPVYHSRQHFLILKFPSTYRNLLAAGIQHDYSMGFADDIGFRASIATPFPWYDLEEEKETTLMIHPFALMDVSLKDYLKYEPEEAVEASHKLYLTTKAAKGEFTILWHNSSFSPHHGWKGWRIVFEKILSFATESSTDYLKE